MGGLGRGTRGERGKGERGGKGEGGEGEKEERGVRRRGGEGYYLLLPVVPCHHLFSPVAARCHSLSPVVTRYYPLSPVGSAVTRRQLMSSVVTRRTRRHPLPPNPSPLPSPPTFLEIVTDRGREFNNFGGFIQSKIHIFAEYYPISFIYRLKPFQDVYQPISRCWFQSG